MSMKFLKVEKCYYKLKNLKTVKCGYLREKSFHHSLRNAKKYHWKRFLKNLTIFGTFFEEIERYFVLSKFRRSVSRDGIDRLDCARADWSFKYLMISINASRQNPSSRATPGQTTVFNIGRQFFFSFSFH